MAKLIIIDNNGFEDFYELRDGITSIGRTSENDIKLPVKSVSRRHCQIDKIGETYKISDAGSRNGMKINGLSKKEHFLEIGDKIEIGDYLLFFEEILDKIEDPVSGGQDPFQVVFRLEVIEGADSGKQHDIGGSRSLTIGRNKRNIIVINDSAVSSFHAEIWPRGDSYFLRDLGSTNGILVDGEPIKEIELDGGQEILFGDTVMRVIAVATYKQKVALDDIKGSGAEVIDVTEMMDQISPVPNQEVFAPEAEEPEIEISQSDIPQPEDFGPEDFEPEDFEPEISQPEVPRPEVSRPEVSRPEVSQPEVFEQKPFGMTPEPEDAFGLSAAVEEESFGPEKKPMSPIKRYAIVTVVLLVLVAAFVVVLKMTSGPEVDKDNLLGLDGSFETGLKADVPTGWTVFAFPQDTNPGITLAEDEAKHGSFSLRIGADPDSAGVSKIECTHTKGIAVTPESEYVLSGWIKTESLDGIAALSIRFEGANNTSWTYTSDFQTGTNDWKQVNKKIFSPAWAENMRVSCVKIDAGGKGVAWFDDLSIAAIKSGNESAPRPLWLWGDLYAEVSANGTMSLRQGNSYLLRNIQLSPTGRMSLGKQNFFRQEYAAVDDYKIENNRAIIKGRFYEPVSRKIYSFTQEVSVSKPEEIIFWEKAPPIKIKRADVRLSVGSEGDLKGLGFSAVLDKKLAAESWLYQSGTKKRFYKEIREGLGITEFYIESSADKASIVVPSSALTIIPHQEGGGYLMALEPEDAAGVTGRAFSLRIQSVSEGDIKAMISEGKLARRAFKEEKNYSKAIPLIKGFIEKYGHLGRDYVAEPAKVLEWLRKEQSGLKDEIGTMVANIKASKSAGKYNVKLKTDAKSLLEKTDRFFPDKEDVLQKQAEALRDQLKNYSAQDENAKKLLEMAKQSAEKKQWVIAESACFQIIDEYPDTDYAKSAQSLLDEIAKLKKEK